MPNGTAVTLTNNETVQLDLNSVSFPNQTFTRMGPRLIAGVVDDPTWQGVYIWQEVDGIYKPLGDMVFKEQSDGSVLWTVYPWTSTEGGFDKRAAEFIAQQLELYASGHYTGNKVEMLSLAAGVKFAEAAKSS